jgi:ATP-dependent protease ClpP protease subunit
MKREWYRFQAKAGEAVADITVFGDIGKSYWDDDTVTAAAFIDDLKALPESVTTIRVHVNSYGGDVFDAATIANALRAQRTEKGRTVETLIDGVAASAATIITSAGSPIRIADNGMMMIHDPSSWGAGNATAFRKLADALDGIKHSIIAAYRWVSGKSEDELATLMADETWLEPADAVEIGLATEIVAGVKATACLSRQSLGDLTRVPEKFRARLEALVAAPEPPVKEPAPPTPAAATDVLRLCREGGCLDAAESLLAAGATLDQVEARITTEREQREAVAAHAEQIRGACAIAHLPELADAYIAGAMPLAQVKAQLAVLAPKFDQAHIDGTLNPDGTKSSQSRIDVAGIYAERNSRKEK